MSHPTYLRLQAITQKLGSQATTPKGVLSYLRRQDAKSKIRSLTSQLTYRDWKIAETKRKSDPEAKRAQHDKTFRKSYLARLCRREKRAIDSSGDIEKVCSFYDRIQERKNELEEIRRLREVANCRTETAKLTDVGYLIPVDAETARKFTRINMTGKNATIQPTRLPSYRDYSSGETRWKNGRPVSYTRATNDNYVRSFAIVASPTLLEYAFCEGFYRVELPNGYHWDIDDNGLRAVNQHGDDYHPTARDLIYDLASQNIVDAIHENQETRRRMRAEKTIELAQLEGVHVCLADSLRAGNCLVGSLSFATRHDLDPSSHYPASRLLAIANGDASRVRIVTTAARIRHKQELEQGYCELKKHTYH